MDDARRIPGYAGGAKVVFVCNACGKVLGHGHFTRIPEDSNVEFERLLGIHGHEDELCCGSCCPKLEVAA
jgi:hypothetical protein